MPVLPSLHFSAIFLVAFTSVAGAQNQSAPNTPESYQPQSGQAGKDVVWVPTPQVAVDKMMELARVGPSDIVMDLGSGDGRTVITAAKLGARAMGIEYNPEMVEYAQKNALAAGVSNTASFVKADLFETDLSRATVITLFLLPDINLRLRPKLLDLKPGTRVASNTFTMGDWAPDAEVNLYGDSGCENSYCKVLFWIVPQRFAGAYRIAQGELMLKQEYQMLTGTLKARGATLEVKGRVVGEEIELSAGNQRYRGRLMGRTLELREGS